MVRQFLLLAGVALGASAFAVTPQRVEASSLVNDMQARSISLRDLPFVTYDPQTKSLKNMPVRKKAPGAQVHWKRPAGQFWGTGFNTTSGGWYSFTPLCLRPYDEYTLENISTGVTGTPLWDVAVLVDTSVPGGVYENVPSEENNVTVGYIWGESCAAPRLSYNGGVPFPTLFKDSVQVKEPYNKVRISAAYNLSETFGAPMPVSSHFTSLFCLDDQEAEGLTPVNGLDVYEGMNKNFGMLFGTNNSEYNAAAVRFEKPDKPYLLNNIQWYYFSTGPIPKDIPLKAYVFKTEKPNEEYTDGKGGVLEGASLKELIAYSESVVPATDTPADGAIVFTFKEVDPVTGAETDLSLEIEDDIIIMVTGFNENLGNGEAITSVMSLNMLDEGYGNLGFVGYVEETETGFSKYGLLSLKSMFGFNTVPGIFADVSYPWIFSSDGVDEVHLPNAGTTTADFQGLEYYLIMVSSSDTSDFEITYNGEEECDWVSLTNIIDISDIDPNTGEEVFTGISQISLAASPNPENISRTCVVKVSIPAASFELTIRQGTENNAVEVVGVDAKGAVYYDLSGRRVVNPEKGIYIKKNGNKSEKVVF